jgi:DNA-directed RNA polymerase
VRSRVTVSTGYEAPIAKEKAASAVAPNVVHACDASHLLRTVAAAADEGIVDVATVHDSFGCLPSRATRFNQIIREQFLRMYQEHDVLNELYESAMADLTQAGQERLQNELQQHGFNDGPPEKGELDIKEILNARYAFA